MIQKFSLLFLLVLFLAIVACDDGGGVSKKDDPNELVSSSSTLVLPHDSLSSGFVPNPNSSSSLDPLSSGAIDTTGQPFSSSSVFVPEDSVATWMGQSALIITEVISANIDWDDHEGDDPGWVEIYNAGSETANLSGYSLVENLKNPRKWIFGNETIGPKQFRIVFCSKKDLPTAPIGTDGSNTHYRTHTNWKLEKEGGTIYLIDYNWSIRDSVTYPALEPGVSWGRVDGGGWKYFAKPTPEKKNTEADPFEGMAQPVEFGNQQAGFYSEPISLNPPSSPDGAEIRCTFDGSLPTKNSPVFAASEFLGSSTIVRCGAYKSGLLTKNIVTNTYFIGEQISGMPIVSIAVDPYDMFDSKNGYYSQGVSSCVEPCKEANYWWDLELPVHVEFFDNPSVGSKRAWNIDAGLSIMGQWSRYNPKKSVSIKMKEEYQDGRLHYPLFKTRPENQKFKAFNLRNNGNRFHWDYIGDALGAAMVEGSGVDYQRSRQVVVFYNGEYYGIHDMRERLNEHYIETNYGIDPSTVDIVKHLENNKITANGGSTDAYLQMLDFVISSDFSGSNNAAYATMRTMVDVGNLADYMALEIHLRNGDWPNNNVRAWRAAPDQPWKFIIYDLDHAFDFEWSVSGFGEWTNMFEWIKRGGSSSCNDAKCFAQIFNKLIKNNDFKRLFINRSAVMLKNYLTSSRADSIADAMTATIPSQEMSRDLARWSRNEGAYFSKTGSALKDFFRRRESVTWSEYRSEFDLDSDITVSIQSSGNGVVLMEGMTLPPSNSNTTNYTGTFFGGNDMELTAVPTQAGAVFVKWEDGSIENPRIVKPNNGATYVATFK